MADVNPRAAKMDPSLPSARFIQISCEALRSEGFPLRRRLPFAEPYRVNYIQSRRWYFRRMGRNDGPPIKRD